MTIWQKRIKAITDKGMNQSNIASQAGVSRAAISLIAKGSRKNPSFDVGSGILKVCKMLSIDIKE